MSPHARCAGSLSLKAAGGLHRRKEEPLRSAVSGRYHGDEPPGSDSGGSPRERGNLRRNFGEIRINLSN